MQRTCARRGPRARLETAIEAAGTIDIDGVPTEVEIQSGPTTDRPGTWVAKYAPHGAEKCRKNLDGGG